MDHLFDRRIIFVGGKGGVGKTTTAGALGLMAADTGRTTLLVSTDPAHSLGDVFDIRIGNQETPLGTNLTGLEIDPEAEADRHVETVKMSMKSLVAPKMYGEIDRQLDLARHSPGTMEAALLERMADLMADARSRFDLLIFDTAPSGTHDPPSRAPGADGGLERRNARVSGPVAETRRAYPVVRQAAFEGKTSSG